MNVLELQTGRFRSQVTSIPELNPLPTPYIRLQVPAGQMPRSLHVGISLVHILYNTGATISVRLKRQGGLVGELRFRVAQQDGVGLYDHNVMPPCVTYINRLEDGSPDDIPSMDGAGPIPADALRWDFVTEAGDEGMCVTSPIHFIADIDEVELLANEAGSWGISILANNNVITGIYGYAYFFLGMISNALR